MSSFIQINDTTKEGTTKRLNDASPNGKSRDWKGKKQRSLLMAEHYYHAELTKKAKRMEECCSVLTFKQTNEGLKLYQANNCKVRLCPMCNWRRSLKIAFQNKRIVEVANERHKLRWLFLTLTVKNCPGDELKKTIDSMMKAWNRFIGYKDIKQAVKGFFRALEITKDWDEFITRKRYYKNPSYYKRQGLEIGDPNPNYQTYHPHFHVLLCVPPSYFSKHKYIKQEQWRQFWKKAIRVDYDPIVDVRTVKPKKDVDFDQIEDEIKQAIKEQKAIQEVSKYPIKDSDVLPTDKLTADGIETVLTLDTAIAYKRLIGYGGILKELHKELKLDDAEDGDLVRVTDEDPTANAIGEVMAYWHIGIKDYVIYSSKKWRTNKGELIDPETGELHK